MLKTLIKKQFFELFQSYVRDRKTGKRQSRGKTVGMIILFAFIFAYVAFMMFGLSTLLASALLSKEAATGNEWLYFAIMGIMAILLGTFGSVFNTYSGLYQAKDNELLLSMPIKPGTILFARMTGVMAMSALYSSIVWLPAVLNYWIRKGVSALAVLNPLILFLAIAVFVSAVTCILGWIVALISAKLRHKNIISVIISLVFFGAYYYVCVRLNVIITSLINNTEAVGSVVKRWIFPVYHLGLGAAGSIPSMLIFIALSAVLFGILYMILSRSFLSLLTTKKGEKKAVYREEPVKSQSAKKALLNREFKRFTNCTVYMLNSGFSAVMSIAAAVIALVRMDSVRTYMDRAMAALGMDPGITVVFAALIVLLIFSMGQISSASVSLEGKYLWIIRSMPVRTPEILEAKANLHVAVNSVPAVLSVVLFGIIFKAEIYELILLAAVAWTFIWFTAELGLMMDLLKPNLEWTSEMVPVKQGLPLLFSMMISSVVAFVPGLVYIFLLNKLPAAAYLAFMGVFLSLTVRLLKRWIETRGVERFEKL